MASGNFKTQPPALQFKENKYLKQAEYKNRIQRHFAIIRPFFTFCLIYMNDIFDLSKGCNYVSIIYFQFLC